jgi:predicted transcriptional regulator
MTFVNLELPDAVADALRRMAAEQHTTMEAIATAVIQDALGDDPALRAMAEAGEAEIAAGQGVPHEDVMAGMRRWAADLRARHASR